MGRLHKPTAQHIAEGTLRASRANPAEPQYEPVAPAMPETVELRPAAAAEWDRVAPLLEAQRVLTKVDRVALATYCLLVADLDALEATKRAPDWSPIIADVSVDGAGVEHVKPRAHPVLAQTVRTANELRHYMGQLGMTPSSRPRVSSGGGSPPVGATSGGSGGSAFEQFKARRKTLAG